jgi:hypothetical protein
MPPAARAARQSTARRIRVLVATVLAAVPLAAQGPLSVAIIAAPAGNPIHEGTPGFTVSASGFDATDLPLQLTVQISTRADFGGTLLADTTVAGVTTTTIVIPRLLPQSITIWWRARVRTARGAISFSNAEGPRTTSPWLVLISPNNLNGSTLATRHPTFLWTSVGIRPPVGPWQYELLITRTSDHVQVPAFRSPFDTVYTSTIELESNTSYRWAVLATAGTGDTVRVQSFASFVILDPNAPIATILYQGFPNPFPSTRLSTTCIWFDLARQAEVRLDVLDLRGNLVAKILPGRGLGPVFPPGRYGRAAIGSDSGCDDRLTWDGRDAAGRFVPSGVYLIRFSGDGKTTTTKVVWKGR